MSPSILCWKTAADGDLFREREIEAVESREEAVVSKDVRVRVQDSVRRTEVRQDDGDVALSGRVEDVRNLDDSRL